MNLIQCPCCILCSIYVAVIPVPCRTHKCTQLQEYVPRLRPRYHQIYHDSIITSKPTFELKISNAIHYSWHRLISSREAPATESGLGLVSWFIRLFLPMYILYSIACLSCQRRITFTLGTYSLAASVRYPSDMHNLSRVILHIVNDAIPRGHAIHTNF